MDEVTPPHDSNQIRIDSFQRGISYSSKLFQIYIFYVQIIWIWNLYISNTMDSWLVTVQNESIVQHIPYMSNKHAHNRKTLVYLWSGDQES